MVSRLSFYLNNIKKKVINWCIDIIQSNSKTPYSCELVHVFCRQILFIIIEIIFLSDRYVYMWDIFRSWILSCIIPLLERLLITGVVGYRSVTFTYYKNCKDIYPLCLWEVLRLWVRITTISYIVCPDSVTKQGSAMGTNNHHRLNSVSWLCDYTRIRGDLGLPYDWIMFHNVSIQSQLII